MSPISAPASQREPLLRSFRRIRAATEALVEPLATEDMVVQTMPDVSPARWHLAHMTWFFETFVLRRFAPSYRSPDERYHDLFNSYYETVGEAWPRARRGDLSRPTVAEVREWRRQVDQAMGDLLERAPGEAWEAMAPVVTVGLHHEQQHQELLLMDVKHVFATNPLRPVYRALAAPPATEAAPLVWHAYEGGVREVGFDGPGFAFDNERPRHKVHLEPFELADRLVTAGEYLAFVQDGGYQRPELWLSAGWDLVRQEGWRAPLYWEEAPDGWQVMTLGGLRPLSPAEPVCHVSYFEADAFARWAGARLPTEFEWEQACPARPAEGVFLESGAFHPRPRDPASAGPGPAQMFGDLWEWTASPYVAYPGYRPFEGSLGEYNGKFMVNQLVLRGGCCATPADHVRRTYRNFYLPHQRWMFSGLRLAR